MGSFVANATPPAGARARAATAVMDTIGVALAGVAAVQGAGQVGIEAHAR